MSELLHIRVIAAPEPAFQAVSRLKGLLEVDSYRGPFPSRKSPGLVHFYLDGRLRQTAAPALAAQVERLERKCARLLAALELLTFCEHGQGLDCPDCEPVPDLVRQALEGEAVRPT